MLYKKRCSYWLNDLKPTEYSIEGLTGALVNYMKASSQAMLAQLKMGNVQNESIVAASRSLAELIMHDRKCY